MNWLDSWRRSQAIVDAYLRGDKLEVIGAEFGISRQRVEQIARQAGCPHREPHKRPTPRKTLGGAP